MSSNGSGLVVVESGREKLIEIYEAKWEAVIPEHAYYTLLEDTDNHKKCAKCKRVESNQLKCWPCDHVFCKHCVEKIPMQDDNFPDVTFWWKCGCGELASTVTGVTIGPLIHNYSSVKFPTYYENNDYNQM